MFQALCNGGAGWQEGSEDLEATMLRIRREEASPEDLNRTLDPVMGEAEEEDLEPGMKIGGLAFEGWPGDKKKMMQEQKR